MNIRLRPPHVLLAFGIGLGSAPLLAGETFASWRITQGVPAAALVTSDTDGDGISLLMEYALGSSPSVASTANQHTVTVGTQSISMGYVPLRTDIAYRVESSRDLQNWSAATITQGNGLLNTTVTANLVTARPASTYLRLVVTLLDSSVDPYYAANFAMIQGSTYLAKPIQTKPTTKPTSLATASYVDNRFNTRIYKATSVTDTSSTGLTHLRHEYSRKQAFNSDSSRFIVQSSDGFIAYDRLTNAITGSVLTTNAPDNVTTSSNGGYVIASWSKARGLTMAQAAAAGINLTDGTRAYNRNFASFRQLNAKGEHADTAVDSTGNEVYVTPNYDGTRNPDVTDGYCYYRRLDNGVATVLPVNLYQGTSEGVHFCGASYHRPGWVLISTYGSGSGTAWKDQMVLLCELKPANQRLIRIAHHQTVPSTFYWRQPHANMSPDLTKVLFASAFGSTVSESYMAALPSWAIPLAQP